MAYDEELYVLGHTIWILLLTLLTLAYVAVGLRLWVRYRITRSPGWDDFTMVLTLSLFTIYCAFIMINTIRASKSTLVTAENIMFTLVYVQLIKVFYILTTTTLKISLGLFFLRVLTKRWQTLLFHIILAISAVYGLFYVLTTIFVCGDPADIADVLVGSKKCLPSTFILSTGYLYGIINVIADWTFVLVPISVLIESDLDRRSKISVGIVMALGAIGSVSSIMRMVYLKGLLLNSHGMNGDTIRATIWATAEPGTGIIAGSLALLRPLIRNITTTVRTQYHVRKSSKTSLSSSSYGEDAIILSSQVANDGSMIRPSCEYPPWSPIVSYGQANIQRVISIKGGRIVSREG